MVPKLFSDNIIDSLIWVVVVATYLLRHSFEGLQVHLHINKITMIALVRAVIVMVMLMTVFLFIHFILLKLYHLLKLIVSILRVMTVVLNSAGTRAIFHFNIR